MKITWKERLEQYPALTDFENWPVIDIDTVPKLRRKAFLTNQRIIAMVLSGQTLKQVAKAVGYSESKVCKLMNKVLGGEDREPPRLTQGLLPYSSFIKRYFKGALPKLIDDITHRPCAFEKLLDEVPGLRESLDEMIIAKLDDKDYAQSLSPAWLHGHFKSFLAQAHWPSDKYPYTTDSVAYYSVRRYLEQRVEEILTERARKKSWFRSMDRKNLSRRAYRAVQLDAHKLDLAVTVHLELNNELIPIRLTRLWVLVLIDVDTHCILAFHLSYSAEPNQSDVLKLFDKAIKPWSPIELTTPGFEYTPGAEFPSGEFEGIPVTFSIVQLDNAMTNRAHAIRDVVCEELGATLSFGFPASPTIRGLVESIFDYINFNVSHRYASTTGSHVLDPKRESKKNSKKPPVVTVQILKEALSVVLTHYNVVPQASLGNATPLELLRHHCETQYLRYVPELLRREWRPMMSKTKATVHYRSDGSLKPYVHFLGCRYTGEGLFSIEPKTRITLQYDRDDIRQLEALSLEGEHLGTVFAPKSWQRFPHSDKTRRLIFKMNRKARFIMRDPMSDHLRWLISQCGIPKYATQLLRVSEEYETNSYTIQTVPGRSKPEKTNSQSPSKTLDHTSGKDYEWDINNAYRGKS